MAELRISERRRAVDFGMARGCTGTRPGVNWVYDLKVFDSIIAGTKTANIVSIKPFYSATKSERSIHAYKSGNPLFNHPFNSRYPSP